MKVLVKTLGVVLACIVSLLVTTPPAHADALEIDQSTGISWGGESYSVVIQHLSAPCMTAGWNDDGDRIFVYDCQDDSQRVAVHWWLDDGNGRRGLCINAHGAFSGVWKCNKNFAEGHTIWMRIGRCNGSATNCNVPGNYNNWTAPVSRTTGCNPQPGGGGCSWKAATGAAPRAPKL